MRALVSIASLSLLTIAAAACTVETRSVGEAPAKDAGVTRSDDPNEPAPLPGKRPSKDAGTSEPSANGPTTCRTAAECLGECEDGDDACQDPCLASLPDAEMAELEALASCIQSSDCADMECVQETCAFEFAQCAAE